MSGADGAVTIPANAARCRLCERAANADNQTQSRARKKAAGDTCSGQPPLAKEAFSYEDVFSKERDAAASFAGASRARAAVARVRA